MSEEAAWDAELEAATRFLGAFWKALERVERDEISGSAGLGAVVVRKRFAEARETMFRRHCEQIERNDGNADSGLGIVLVDQKMKLRGVDVSCFMESCSSP
jgi:hypothetical protein